MHTRNEIYHSVEHSLVSLISLPSTLLVLSVAVYVEHNNEEDPTYEAMCDINEHMSCSRVSGVVTSIGLWLSLLALHMAASIP